MSESVASIRIDALDPDTAALWRGVAKIATALGDDGSWCLVGGLMVALFALEAGETARPTTDIDVLAPEGLPKSRPPLTTGNLQTIRIPGGTQALRRTEIVELIVDGEPVLLRRPTLIAAILLKARALPVHDRPDDQRHDLVILLAMLDEPRAARETITAKELGWLRDVETDLSIDDDAIDDLVGADSAQRARAAFRLLTG
jgi:hypothetical protein